MKKFIKVKPASVKLILSGLAVLLLINLLARFGIGIDLTPQQTNIMTIVGALFLMSEVTFFSVIKKTMRGKMNVLDIVISLVALFAILGAAFNLFGMSIQALQPIQGIVDGGLLIFILVEIFREN